ncbi:hypothetical protein [Clostridium hydrogenum]|nr:hypothetical protein [Clostridium hydrogenum]
MKNIAKEKGEIVAEEIVISEEDMKALEEMKDHLANGHLGLVGCTL